MTSPAPGWYPDPGGVAPYRWWNGQAWTTATSDGAPPAATQPTPTAPAAAAAPAAPGYGAGQYGQTAAPQFGATNPQLGATNPQFGSAAGGVPPQQQYGVPAQQPFGQTSIYSQVMNSQSGNNTLWDTNRLAMGTFIASALSILFALGTGFVPLIFTPFFLAFGSKSRGEKLAPLAFGAAIICGVVGFITLRNRF